MSKTIDDIISCDLFWLHWSDSFAEKEIIPIICKYNFLEIIESIIARAVVKIIDQKNVRKWNF